MKCTYKEKLILLVGQLLPILEHTLFGVGFEEELPEETVVGFHQVFFILILPLGLLPSGKRWNALEVENYELMGNTAHHFQAALSCSKSHISGGVKTE